MADIDKVKRNIKRMIDMNAPDEDIDAYLASQGVTIADLGKSAEFVAPAPPPGAVIHGGDGVSYDANNPQINVQRRVSEVGNPDQEAMQQTEMMALKERMAGGGMDSARFAVPMQDALGLGFGGEISSGLAAAVQPGSFGQNYNLNQEVLRQAGDRAKQEMPKTMLASEIAGMLGSGVGLAANGVTAMRAVPKLAGALGTTGGKVAAGLVDSALFGAVSGAGSANPGERGEGALSGAGLGAIGGLAGQALGAGVGKLADAVRPAKDKAIFALQDAAERAGITSRADLQTALAKQGPDSVLFDALGEPGRHLARNARDMSPQARDALESFMQERVAGGRDRLMQSVQRAADVPDGATIDSLQEAVRNQARKPINDAYEAALQGGADLPRAPFEDILQAPAVKAAVDTARTIVMNEVKAGRSPNSAAAVYENAYRLLRDSSDPASRALGKVLKSTLDDQVEGLTGARALAQAAKQQEEAFAIGRQAANPREMNAPAMVSQSAQQYPDNVRKGFGIEALNNLSRARGQGDDATDAVINSLIGSRLKRDSMQAALGPKISEVDEAIARARKAVADKKALVGGSNTNRLMRESATMAGAGGLGAMLTGIADVGTGGMIGLATALGRAGTRKAGQKLTQNAMEKRGAEIAKYLLGSAVPERKLEAARIGMMLGGPIGMAGALGFNSQ